jgi:heme-degrading monooxygenase HmoA
MFVATNRFRVIPDHAAEFEQIWLTRESRLHELPGFVSFQLLRGPQSEDHILYTSSTLWASRADFEAWTKSAQFRHAHSGAGSSRNLTLGPPSFEGFDVLQTITHEARPG